MNDTTKFSHWHLEEEAGSAVLTLDVADAGANALSSAVMQEFDQILEQIESRSYRGVIIRSGKAGRKCPPAAAPER